MAEVDDWTERYRPTSEYQLEGNDKQRQSIRNWLKDWENGTPKKKGIMLVGPPGGFQLSKKLAGKFSAGV